MVLELRIGDVLRLKKAHPCGSFEWMIVRLGADIGIRCLKCRHSVMIARPVLERRIKAFLSRGDEVDVMEKGMKEDAGEAGSGRI